MKKKITFTVLDLSLATRLVVGIIVFAEKANNNESQMMSSDSINWSNHSYSISQMANSYVAIETLYLITFYQTFWIKLLI